MQDDTSYICPFQIVCTQGSTHLCEMALNQVDVLLKVDTGASISIMSKCTFIGTWLHCIHLKTYTGESIHVLGSIVEVEYEGQRELIQSGWMAYVAGVGLATETQPFG